MSDLQTIKRDFVYAGRRVITGGRIGHSVYPISDDGELMEERLYALDKFSAIVGGRYTGAEFAETKSIGVANAKYVDGWHDRESKIDWEAEDRAAEIEIAAKRLAGNAKRLNEIDAIMLPLRKRAQAARARGDYATLIALRAAVAASLDKPPRKDEK